MAPVKRNWGLWKQSVTWPKSLDRFWMEGFWDVHFVSRSNDNVCGSLYPTRFSVLVCPLPTLKKDNRRSPAERNKVKFITNYQWHAVLWWQGSVIIKGCYQHHITCVGVSEICFRQVDRLHVIAFVDVFISRYFVPRKLNIWIGVKWDDNEESLIHYGVFSQWKGEESDSSG